MLALGSMRRGVRPTESDLLVVGVGVGVGVGVVVAVCVFEVSRRVCVVLASAVVRRTAVVGAGVVVAASGVKIGESLISEVLTQAVHANNTATAQATNPAPADLWLPLMAKAFPAGGWV